MDPLKAEIEIGRLKETNKALAENGNKLIEIVKGMKQKLNTIKDNFNDILDIASLFGDAEGTNKEVVILQLLSDEKKGEKIANALLEIKKQLEENG